MDPLRSRRTIDSAHENQRAFLRVLGALMIGIGAILTLVGIGSFFSSFNSGTPDYFWCAFLGLPLLGIGIGVTRFAFMGAVARYAANEVAPVAKDTINYMAEETAGSVQRVAQAVGEGLASAGRKQVLLRCHKCNGENASDAKFCNGCGAALSKSQPCPACKELNDPDARYCDNCGGALQARAGPH